MQAKIGFIIACFLAQLSAENANDIDTITGEWQTVRHGAKVEITDCGDGSPCGFLISVSEEVRGGATLDEKNKNPALRSRSLVGLPILWGYESGEMGWRKGQLYNPETGQTFRSSIKIISADQINVRGCFGPFCKTQIWSRIEEIEELQLGDNKHD